MFAQMKRLLRQSTAYTIATFLDRAFAFLLVPLYTRFLTQGEYGDFSLLLAGTAVLWVAYDFGLSSAITRFLYDFDDEASQRRYLGSMWLFMTLMGGGGTLLLTLVGAGPLSRIFKDIPYWPYVVLAMWAMWLQTAGIIPRILMRVREQSRRYVAVIAAQSSLLLVAVVVFVVVLRLGLLGAVLAVFTEGLVVYVFYTAYTLRNSSFAFWWDRIARSLAFGFPVLFLEAGWWILDSADRLLLRHWTTAATVALYSVGYAIGRVLVSVSLSIDRAWTPFFFARVKDEDPEAKTMASYAATYFTLAVAACGLVLVVFARAAVLVAGGPSYLPAARVTPLIVIACVIQGMFYVPSRGLFQRKKTGSLPYIIGAGAATNLLLNLWLIPAYGMMGAAVATIAAYAVVVGLTFAVSQRHYHIDYQVARMAKVLGVLVALTVVSMAYRPATWYLSLVWGLALLAAAPLSLYLLGFFEHRELAFVRRFLSARRAQAEVSP
jgi:O-antigen/teichoic acid export membrane protein